MLHLNLLLAVLISFPCIAQKADLIFTNKKIFTADTSRLYAQALAIQGNKIVALGSNQAIEKLASPKTTSIDLQEKTLVPGFNDAHDHAAFEDSPAPWS